MHAIIKEYIFEIPSVCTRAEEDQPPPRPPGPPPPPQVNPPKSGALLGSNAPVPPPPTSYQEHLASYQEIIDQVNLLNSTDLEDITLSNGDWTAAWDTEENNWYFHNK